MHDLTLVVDGLRTAGSYLVAILGAVIAIATLAYFCWGPLARWVRFYPNDHSQVLGQDAYGTWRWLEVDGDIYWFEDPPR